MNSREGPHILRMYVDHTGLICSRLFQNYAFKGWLSLETMKLWLFVLTKTPFLIALIKADIGQHFHNSEKSTRRRHRHKIIKTNPKTLVSPLLIHPQGSQGSQGCQKMRQDPLNMSVEVWLVFLTFFLQLLWFLKFVSLGGNLSAKGKQFRW